MSLGSGSASICDDESVVNTNFTLFILCISTLSSFSVGTSVSLFVQIHSSFV